MKIKIILKKLMLLISIVISFSAFSQTLDNLQDIVKHALLHSPEIRSAQIQLNTARLNDEISASYLYPNVSFKAEKMKLKDFPIIDSNGKSHDVDTRFNQTLTINQPIYNAQYLFSKDESILKIEKQKLALLKTKQETLKAVISKYLDLNEQNIKVEIAKNNILNLEQKLKKITNLVNNGLAIKIELIEVKAKLDSAKDDLILSKNKLFIMKNELSELIQGPVKKIQYLSPFDIPKVKNKSLELWQLEANNHNVQKKIFSIDNKTNAVLINKVKREYAPTVNLTYQKTVTDIKSIEDEETISLSANFTLFSGLSTSSQEQIYQQQLELTRLQSYKHQLNVEKSIHNSWQEFNALQKSITNYKNTLSVKQKWVKLARIRKDNGLGSVSEVIRAEEDWLEALNKITTYHKRFILSYIDLLYLSGALTLENIKSISALFNTKSLSLKL